MLNVPCSIIHFYGILLKQSSHPEITAMKNLLLFVFLCLGNLLFGQTGSLQIKCLKNGTSQILSNLPIKVWKDTVCKDGILGENGILFLRDLPVGENSLWIQNSDLSKTLKGTVFIQENQVAQLTFMIDSSFTQLNNQNSGRNSQISKDGDQKAITQNYDQMNLPINREMQLLECVVISTYRVQLNYSNGTSGCTVSREDIARLPIRSADGVASTVGGVNMVEGTSEMHMRGSRSNDVAYYLDGMRISNADNIPKSYIGGITVRTGGIPANYGDVTGGVISIDSRSSIGNLNSYPQDRERRKKKAAEKESVEEQALFNYDHFSPIYENDFLSPLAHPHSTFGIDVDRASWNFIKTQIRNGGIINRDAVKLEEMINSFKTRELIVPENELIHLELERNPCSWNPKHELVTVHLKAKDLPKDLPRKPHNFVFLVDVSGSMSSENKLPLLVEGLKNFVQTLKENDRVAIVTYAGNSGVVLQPTLCTDKSKIISALNNLSSGGSTNGIGGIQEAYSLAEKNYDPELNNRIILATDGDFNVGINSTGDLENYISQKRGKGIYLTALGFGMGNYKNSILETLADKGDGNHFYINSISDAKKVLVNDIGNLMNIARDVKLNVEFNPNLVCSYRLIGYENRLMKPKDFMDDTKDGGEMGYGHCVTAVYEIERGTAENDETHFVQSSGNSDESELAFVKLRYKAFEDSSSVEKRFALKNNSAVIPNDLLNLIIPFGLHLRDSAFKGETSIAYLHERAKSFDAKGEEEVELKKIILAMM